MNNFNTSPEPIAQPVETKTTPIIPNQVPVPPAVPISVKLKNFKPPALPSSFIIYALICFVATTVLHWGFHPKITIILYLAGAIIGMYMLEIAEKIVKQTPSPFRSVLVQTIMWVLAVFALTSSSGVLGRGVVLFINLRLLYLQLIEFKKNGNINTWFSQVDMAFNFPQTKFYLWVAFVAFIIQATLFVLV